MGDGASYWFPTLPTVRVTDGDGHIQTETAVDIFSFDVDEEGTAVAIRTQSEGWLDLVAWCIPEGDRQVRQALETATPLASGIFLWGSHTAYTRPADVYRHLVHGQVYEDRYQWPRYVRIHSENDAHALYVILTGLYRSSGSQLYDCLRKQLVFSVLGRQGADGAWRHGEWTTHMEAHFRLHCSAMHMLMDFLQEFRDEAAGNGLQRAAEFVGTQHDRTRFGAWFYHDELETSIERMKTSPFRWVKSRALGKSEANMLVLNTQLDTTVALERYREVTGDDRYSDTVSSAVGCTHAVLGLRSATWLYRPLWFAVGLTLLPTQRAVTLPLVTRAIKRVGWKYLANWLPNVKGLFPRLVMPDGYICRALTLEGVADPYLSINAMDLARHIRRIPDPNTLGILSDALRFAERMQITAHWAERPPTQYALGFWQEVFYHLCMLDPAQEYRTRLAAAVYEAVKCGVGIAPSLLGANAEAVVPSRQVGNWRTMESELVVVNLSRKGSEEILVVNSGGDTYELRRSSDCQDWLRGELLLSPAVRESEDMLVLPAGAWISIRR